MDTYTDNGAGAGDQRYELGISNGYYDDIAAGKGFTAVANTGFLVPGDIIFLSAGDMIPADCRVIQSKDLFISQSMLKYSATNSRI